ncbi:gamma-glutamyltransferase [Leptospira borgpetersenii]|uniref:Glutathione hydrolase proenzyme n=1 Tax=Leptospira borgpetersenii serovar Hardjo-bovis (strain JB197) TaxID=355277 RepID=Q04RP6_LEPBJ|nr:gamma-glutamyltransferase [Leptospira borgpetersenii]ABJ76424.1 Gamma-glutamyltransferase [Leptospira borgpetersenii serovar Hardjo-bovis str. JB197]ABJ78870.1 Gamma-glutamyltransferase [Leptospira borgpetersenii serovar Hardjo-bovis str. L550]AMX58147.1 gamma-glutamyltransferase [Leptospira borgpetersenii serovar Hardjo]AMX61399.1 gamma-glutamyltransferase [Leptospira borgpetersenii serovar Hardjo]AMX64644.1 gamma-glutamyltransferase [Leptospira borgpetersenii serovar Hardjo]
MKQITIRIILILLLFSCRETSLTIEGKRISTDLLVTPSHGKTHVDYFSESKNLMIATDSPEATQAGIEVGLLGGNVVDVAVATSFAISVTRPHSTGLGGGGFLILYLKEFSEPIAFDFRERAPNAASRDMYKKKPKEDSLLGFRAVGVPGNVAGLVQIQKRYGKLSLKTVISPAIRLAEKGFPMYPDLQSAIQKSSKDMDQEMKGIFLPGGRVPELKSILVQKDLANSLKLISETGEKEFYHGKIADAITTAMKANGGLITSQDLSDFKVIEKKTLKTKYRDYTIYTMPPPSSGIHLLTMLSMLEKEPLKEMYEKDSALYYHFVTEVMRRGYADRAVFGGDSAFTRIPVDRLLSKKYAEEKISDFDPKIASSSSSFLKTLNFGVESPQTTHISVMDREGNSISTTQSINFRFGASVVAPGTGIVLNDTMDDFSRAPGEPNVYGLIGAEANSILPKKTPLSSMSPTIVFKGKEPFLTTGAPGGAYIINAVLQSLVYNLDFNLTLYESVARGRIHHQLFPDAVFIEKSVNERNVFDGLSSKKHDIRIAPNFAKLFSVKRENGMLYGASDPRGEGATGGL